MTDAMIQQLTQFGVAGLMGVLWVWERLHSRKRDQQLSEAHGALVEDREQLHEVVELVRQNTVAIERFAQTQVRLQELLERMHHDQAKRAA